MGPKTKKLLFELKLNVADIFRNLFEGKYNPLFDTLDIEILRETVRQTSWVPQ